jgi:O-antigen/teichoic acid export membrane protein
MTTAGEAYVGRRVAAVSAHRRRKAFVRAGALVFASTLAWHASNFLFNGVTARLLGPARYSELAATIALLYVTSPLLVSIQTVASGTATSLVVSGRLDATRSLLGFYYRRLFVVAAVFAALAALASSAAARFLRLHSGLPIAIVAAGLSLSIVTHCQRGVLQGTQRFGRYAASTLVEATAKIVAIVLVAALVRPSVEGAALAVPAGAICGLVANTLLLRFLPRSRGEPRARPTVEGRPAATGATFILLALLLSADVLAAKRYLPAGLAGLYASVSLAGKAVYFATSAVSLFLFPVFSEQRVRNVDGRRSLVAATGAIALCSAALAALYFLAPEVVIRPLFGAHYDAAAPYLGWIALAFGGYAVAYLAATFLIARRSTAGVVVLGGAAFAQLTALYALHGSIGQIVAVQVVVLCAAAAFLLAAALRAQPLESDR